MEQESRMTETIIRWAVSVAFMILAFIWGYREGQVKGYTYYIEQSKKIEAYLMAIIGELYDKDTGGEGGAE
jgi:hypothetical protein